MQTILLIFTIHLSSVTVSIPTLADEIFISSEVSVVVDYREFMETILRWILKKHMSIILIYLFVYRANGR